MKYMLLVHHDEEVFGKFSETKRQQMLEESVQLTHQLHANDLNEAIQVASKIPSARLGSIEVRPIREFNRQ